MNKITAAQLTEYIKALSAGTTTRELFDRYRQSLEECRAEEVNCAIDSYIETENDYSRIERVVARFIRACGKGLDSEPLSENPNYPVFILTLMEENRKLEIVRKESTAVYKELVKAAEAGTRKDLSDAAAKIKQCLQQFGQIVPHYRKLQNSLFTQLEKYAENMNCLKLMWHIQNEIINALKQLLLLADSESFDFSAFNRMYGTMFMNMGTLIYREEKILYPLADSAVPADVFAEMMNDIDEYGISFGTGEKNREQMAYIPESAVKNSGAIEKINLDVGVLSASEINLILTNLPLDITYVDEHDNVRYFSRGRERIFPRSPGIIGRAVQNCHPPASLHIVQNIIDDFKSRKRKNAEFWIKTGNKFVHIRYFPLFDGCSYRGVLEVSQDIEHLRSLEGEKRLLDEN